ncbi:MAG TPA: hydrogenase small subunit, partial [Anaerolineales bacterium]|nr:hydrogenase small subunit [Anaerolineales bacterium]
MQGTTIQKTAMQNGVSRRDFLKFCSMMAGVLALPSPYLREIEKALETKQRLPVIWLEMQDCAGCTEALLRATQPTVGQLVLDVLSVDYHETIMAASGNLAEEAKQATIDAGGYLLVVEGSIPVGDGEFYCTIGGKSSLQLLNEAASNAAAIVAVGNCATFGGWPLATPNPTNASYVTEIIKDKPVMNLPGC